MLSEVNRLFVQDHLEKMTMASKMAHYWGEECAWLSHLHKALSYGSKSSLASNHVNLWWWSITVITTIYVLLLLLCKMVCFKFLSVMAQGLYLSSISSSASYKQLAQLCCHGSQWIMAWKLLLRQFHHFIKESGTIAGKGLHLFFPSNQYHYCSCSFKIFAFELKYWACWPNNNSFKDTKVKLAALHMYFDMLISTCTVSCAVHLLTCRSECNTHLLTSLLITSFDLLVSKFPYDCISRSEVCVSVKTTHKADGRHCIYHQNLVVLRGNLYLVFGNDFILLYR